MQKSEYSGSDGEQEGQETMQSREPELSLPSGRFSSTSQRQALHDTLVLPLVARQDVKVEGFRIAWRHSGSLPNNWAKIVPYRNETDEVLRSYPNIGFFLSCITGVYSKGKAKASETP